MKTIDVTTATRAELEAAYLSVERSRNDLRANNRSLSTSLDKVGDIFARLMPEAAIMIDGLAEMAGVDDVHEVKAMSALLGQATYPQWSRDIVDVPQLPAAMTPKTVPATGDAEMMLTAKIHAAICDLDHHVLFDMKPRHAKLVEALISAIDEGFDAALKQHLPKMAEGQPAAAPVEPLSKDDRPVAQDAYNALCDALMDVDMGQAILRQDLRAAMYRSFIARVSAAAATLRHGLVAAEEAVSDQGFGADRTEPADAPF